MVLEWVGPLLLCRDEITRVPGSIPGVYLLHVSAVARGGYSTFYAGQASDLRRRLLQHLGPRSSKVSIRAARELDVAYWSAAPVEDTRLLSPIESGLVLLLNPICNGQVPAAAPVFVNLPPLSYRAVLNEETTSYEH